MNKLSAVLDPFAQQLKPVLKDVKNQVAPAEKLESEGGQAKAAEGGGQSAEQIKKANEDFTKALYGVEETPKESPKPQAQANLQKEAPPLNPETQKALEGKTPEEQQKLLQLKQQLHQQNYYVPTFERRAEKEQEEVQEDQEKKEEEKMQALEEDQEKKKKDENLKAQTQVPKHEKMMGA